MKNNASANERLTAFLEEEKEKFEEEFGSTVDARNIPYWSGKKDEMTELLKSSQLSLLLSVKEMVESRKEEMFQLWRKTREQVYEIRYMEDEYLQSLLDEEINKVKEL